MALCGLCPSLGHDGQEEEKSWEEQLDAHQEQLEREMQEARRMVFRLQVKSRRPNSVAHVNTRTEDRCPEKKGNSLIGLSVTAALIFFSVKREIKVRKKLIRVKCIYIYR